jgi:hypothetical protein
MRGSLTDINSAIQIGKDVLEAANRIWDETGKKYIDNAIKVGDMARALGTTTEEASRLKEMADDVGISVDTLTTSFKLAQKDGFQPSIEGLAEMSDEYLALQPGVERTQFLLDRFGRSGEEMGKLMDKGSEAIRQNAAAIEDSMIVTQKAYDQAREYQIGVDSLSDSWDAFTYQVAPPLVSAMNSIVNHSRDLFTSLKENGYWYTVTHQLALGDIADKREQADALLKTSSAANEAGGAFESEAEKTKAMADAAKAATDAINATTAANQGMLSLIGTLQGEMDSYNQKWADAVAKYGEASAEVTALEATHAQAMAKIAVDLFIAKLSVDGLTDAEYQAALQAQLTAGLIDQKTVDMANGFNNTANAAANAVWSVNAVGAAANALPKDTWLNIWTTHYEVYSGAQPAAAPMRAHAAGGSFVIPSGYGNEGFRLGNMGTASAGETVSITPKGGQQPAQAGIDYNKMSKAIVTAFAQMGY